MAVDALLDGVVLGAVSSCDYNRETERQRLIDRQSPGSRHGKDPGGEKIGTGQLRVANLACENHARLEMTPPHVTRKSGPLRSITEENQAGRRGGASRGRMLDGVEQPVNALGANQATHIKDDASAEQV